MLNNSFHSGASHSGFGEVRRDRRYVTSDRVFEALRKASAPSAAYNSTQRYPAPKCSKDTRIELLARISSWVDGQGEKPICWLNGRPGSGKSAVSQTIAEKYASEGRLAASFFFSRGDIKRRTMQHVAPTLIMQLLSFFPSIRSAVVAALKKDCMIPRKVLWEQMEKLLVQSLCTVTETANKPILIILDALDECDDESLVLELITLAALLPQSKTLPLRLLFTSRPESWIQSRFHQSEISSATLFLDIHSFSVDADIRLFLRDALDDVYEQHIQVMKYHPRPWPSPEDFERVVNKSKGLFIFAHTVAKFVGDEMHHPAERLRVILEHKASADSVYSELNSLYRDIIRTLPKDGIVWLTLGFIPCMAVPMSSMGLLKLFGRPDSDARAIIHALSPVLLVSKDRKQPIQFYHASFPDFLVNPERPQKPLTVLSKSHKLMAWMCFETMLASLECDMCGICDPSRPNSKVPNLTEQREAVFDEALLYACRFWSHHLAQLSGDGVVNEELLGPLNRFSTKVLLYWIEVLSLLGELDSAVVMLRDGIRWLRTLHEIARDVLALLEDAERLVVLYGDCISECALHVYLTALTLTTKNNPIYKTFWRQKFWTLTIQPGMPETWLPLRRTINLRPHIHSVVFSPNGDSIATAGMRQGVQVWSIITGTNIASLGDCSSTSHLVSFSPSGAFLAAAFEGGTVVVWDSKIGRERLKHEGCHTEPITCIEFSPDSALLASGSRDHVIQVWSMESAQALHRLATHRGPVTSLAFSSDSQRLFSGSEDTSVIAWNMVDGMVVHRMLGHRKSVSCVAVSKDGRLLASGSEDKTVKLWDPSSGLCTQKLSNRHSTRVRSIHFFDEDKHLVTVYNDVIASWSIGSPNKYKTVWSATECFKGLRKYLPELETKLPGRRASDIPLRSVLSKKRKSPLSQISASFSNQTSSIVFACHGLVFTGTLPNAIRSDPVVAPRVAITTAISPNGDWAASVNTAGLLQIIDLSVPTRSRNKDEKMNKLYPLCLIEKIIPAPCGTRFIIKNQQGWYMVYGNCRIMIQINTGLLSLVRYDSNFQFKFSGNSNYYLCVLSSLLTDDKCSVRVYNAVIGDQIAHFSGLKKVHAFVSSTDAEWIACCHGSGKIDVFSVVGRARRRMSMPGGDTLVNVLAFSTSGSSLVGGFKTGVVRVWDRISGESKATFDGSPSMVTALACRTVTDGVQVVIGREDGSLSLWSPSKSVSHNILRSDQATVKNIDFIRLPDNATRNNRNRVTTRCEDGSIFTWAVPHDAAMRNCACSGRETDGVTNRHLISQYGPDEAVDSLSQALYRIRKDGWLVSGERRLIWIPAEMRPHGKDKLFVSELYRFVTIIAPSGFPFFLSLRAS